MVEQILNIRSYSVSPDVRGSPVLSVLTDKQRLSYRGKALITSFIRCAYDGVPFKARVIERETPTEGKYQVFERVD